MISVSPEHKDKMKSERSKHLKTCLRSNPIFEDAEKKSEIRVSDLQSRPLWGRTDEETQEVLVPQQVCGFVSHCVHISVETSTCYETQSRVIVLITCLWKDDVKFLITWRMKHVRLFSLVLGSAGFCWVLLLSLSWWTRLRTEVFVTLTNPNPLQVSQSLMWSTWNKCRWDIEMMWNRHKCHSAGCQGSEGSVGRVVHRCSSCGRLRWLFVVRCRSTRRKSAEKQVSQRGVTHFMQHAVSSAATEFYSHRTEAGPGPVSTVSAPINSDQNGFYDLRSVGGEVWVKRLQMRFRATSRWTEHVDLFTSSTGNKVHIQMIPSGSEPVTSSD